eukprot:356185-Chlamydomonas_euryale.AAC.1
MHACCHGAEFGPSAVLIWLPANVPSFLHPFSSKSATQRATPPDSCDFPHHHPASSARAQPDRGYRANTHKPGKGSGTTRRHGHAPPASHPPTRSP